ncbi:MAG: glutathione S-transferase N-terminal domain-containing protein [Candidatus Sericytochromatia bacterium]|nr:glutathione S-transferase N-terminal domain-containing protein [Candidatus Sericytochromatia bacterium]
MKLYNLERCPYCKMVRDRLKALNLSYETVEVPSERPDRHEVYAVSGQWTVPVLIDGEQVFDDEDKILAYLDATYGAPSGR